MMDKNAGKMRKPRKPAFRNFRYASGIGLLAALALGACRLFSAPTAPPVMTPTAPPAGATATPLASAPEASPTALSPSLAPPIPAPPTAAPPTVAPPTVAPPTVAPPTVAPPTAPTHPATLRLVMYLVAVGDNGASGEPLGCGDSLVPVSIDVPYTQAVLRAALERLLALKDQHYGQSGLYNALYQSDLRIDGLNIKDGEAIVQLGGRVTLGGECDTPRLIGQLEATALQFSTVQRVTLTLNGKPIREALSLRGAAQKILLAAR